MRARQRHFNPTAAGAVAAYDARFITGLSDGTNMAEWPSRTRTNNATQSTVANQPNYETNEINGNPVVNFTPANFEQFIVNITIPNSFTIIKVFRRKNSGIHNIGLGGGRYDPWWYSDNVTYTSAFGSFNTHGTANASTGVFIDSWQKNQTVSSQVWRNGVSVGASQTPQASNSAFITIGRIYTDYNNGAIGLITMIEQSNAPIRKRLERGAAFSFKIPCS